MSVQSIDEKLRRAGAVLIIMTHILGLVAVLATLGPLIAALLCYLVVAVIIIGYKLLVSSAKGGSHVRG